ncbi:beta-amyrin 28-monooxygenase-like [Pyrus x bretschneideri]|uniref:beta-amyrin 28-monooxygenase-like n=1 Tax=Pyrus x bretschneideri TaxID=225117 RepID=UPI00202F9189|nr:beta-amyrin 28-monooxygenase-like [Pyrus x bretschneideri]
MDAITKEHLDTYWENQKDQVVKVHEVAGKYTSTMSLRFFFNIEDPQVVAELEGFITLISAGFISLPINFPGTKLNRAIEASQKMRKYVENMLVEGRKMRTSSPAGDARGGDYDLWSSMLMQTSSVDGQPMKDSDIANKLCGLIIAGYDNVIATLDSIIMYLSELPHVYDAVLKEQMEIANSKAAGELLNWGDVQKMKYTRCVVSEVLRLKPPVLGTFREAITDFIYEGYLIPKGMKLHWNAYGTHKNPEYFPNPENFDPSRFQGDGPAPFSYVPFGGGAPMCPGREYARFKILVFMHNLVTRFRWEKVFPDEKMIMDPILVPTKGLPIRLYPHASIQRT